MYALVSSGYKFLWNFTRKLTKTWVELTGQAKQNAQLIIAIKLFTDKHNQYSFYKYRWPSLYAVFLSAISLICDPEMTFFSRTYPLIISHPYAVYFWSPYLSHITRNCTYICLEK